MNWLFRPSLLVVVSAALALSALALIVWPRPPDNRPLPLAVPQGDQEIAWLYTATSSGPWERFVKGIRTVVERRQVETPDLGVTLTDRNAFPAETTAIPEVTITAKGMPGQMRFRWYKLTSDLKTQDWVRALLERPPPLAIIGGGSSDLGIALAHSLRDETERRALGAAAPLLLLTTATADDDPATGGDEPLTGIYAGRTFRFCFTNRQMAEAVVDFIWGQESLRPDEDPVWLTYWNDDPYSRDLMQRYLEALRRPAAQGAAQDWARLASFALLGGLPFDAAGVAWGQFRLALPTQLANIPYSIGTFSRPNRWEMEEGRRLIENKLRNFPEQRRPLLVLPAATQPARRFLRALVRFAPVEARRFVIATGDAIAFNTIYRDRNFAWPIQDLPFSLVLFCHRNPVDARVGFPLEQSRRTAALSALEPTPPGTEDLLLFVDLVDALVQGSLEADARSALNADRLKSRLRQARWEPGSGRVGSGGAGPTLFDEQGNRHSGTGEHVVWLQPTIFKRREVLPAATLQVWTRETEGPVGVRRWRLQAMLPVHYDGYEDQERDWEDEAGSERSQ